MCKALEVNRSGYYAYKNTPASMLKTEDERLTALIVKSFNDSNRTYGTERIQKDLCDWDEKVSRRIIKRLMNQAGVGL